MAERDWTWVKDGFPPDGALVEATTESGDVRELRYHAPSGLWLLPDNSMYVYFTPLKWRLLEGATR